jgi:ankyrin repeat protein
MELEYSTLLRRISSHIVLIQACDNGYVEIVVYLLDQIEAPHFRSEGTALIQAATSGQTEIVRILADRGVRLETGDEMILQIVAKNGHIEILQLLLDRRSWNADILNAALEEAISDGHFEVVKLLLSQRPQIRHIQEGTAQAAKKGYLDILQFLVDRGIAFSITDSIKQAMTTHQFQVVRYLYQCRPYGVDSMLLEWASEQGDLDSVKFLLDRDDSDGAKNIALIRAMCKNQFKIVKYLQRGVSNYARSQAWVQTRDKRMKRLLDPGTLSV